MATLEQAIELAVKYHKGQVDKAGNPYILHPLRLMQKMEFESDQIVAVLHDIIEDTPVTLEMLKEMRFKSYVIETIDCLTKQKDEEYDRYIDRICKEYTACIIKLLDLEDNMDLSRLPEI